MKAISRYLLPLISFLSITGWQVTKGQAPAISTISPLTGTVGSLVTIKGSDLNDPSSITIGGVSAVPVSNDGSTLVAMVMPGAISGNVVITTAGGTVTGTDNFVLQKSGSGFTQQNNKLLGSDVAGGARQGNGVAISADGSTAVVGGPYDSGGGAVWVYTLVGGSWVQQGLKLVGTGAIGSSQQGFSVAISADGNTILVGAPNDNNYFGAAWIFTRTAGAWVQQGSKLTGAGITSTTYFGYSVALSADGNTAAVGGYYLGSGGGGAWVFTRSNGVWSAESGRLLGTGSVFGIAGQGYSVALSADGNTLLSGGYEDGWAAGTGIGAAWIFTRTGTTWTQQGNKLVGTGYTTGNVGQGSAVALSADGNTALIGGYDDNNNMGAAWVWTRTGSVWTQQGGKLVGSGGSGSQQGKSVALSADGNTAIVGGYRDGNVIGGGFWVFKREGGSWAQVGSRLNGTGNVGYNEQGYSIALSADGATLIMGGEWDNNQVGAAWVFHTDPVALPLFWLSIDAKAISTNEIKVSWSTSAEINTSYFEVQRSTGNEPYVVVGTVAASGNSNIVNSYTLADKNSFINGVSYHYRIKQIDEDGRYTYSAVTSVRFNSGQQAATWLVYPNPVRRNTPVNLTAVGGGIQPNDIIQVELTNVTGRILYQVKDAVANAGKRLNERLTSLTGGVYTIVIRRKGEQQALQLILQ
jgi:hypothetical protein